MVLVRRIIFQGKPVGYVYIRADLREIDSRLKRYAAIALAVLLLSLIAALLVSSIFGRSVAQPIVDLANVAAAVSQDKNYSTRATPSKEPDEVGLLITAFNDMLTEIQQRDNELRKAHDELEDRVDQRTRELQVSNRELEAFSYSVSHDLRGPVDALNGFTYVLLKEYGGKLDSKAKELLEHIRNSGKRMIQLIDDLLNLSRVTSSVLRSESVDLSAIARSIAEELRRVQPERKVEFVISEYRNCRGRSPTTAYCVGKSFCETPGSTPQLTHPLESSLALRWRMDARPISCETMEPASTHALLTGYSNLFRGSIRPPNSPATVLAWPRSSESSGVMAAKFGLRQKWSGVQRSTSG